MIVEIEKSILQRLGTQYITTFEKVYPNLRHDPTLDDWVTIHFIRDRKEPTRKNAQMFTFNIRMVLYTTSENIYTLDEEETKLRTVFENQYWNSLHYKLDFLEFDILSMPNSGDEQIKTQKVISQKTINVLARAERI